MVCFRWQGSLLEIGRWSTTTAQAAHHSIMHTITLFHSNLHCIFVSMSQITCPMCSFAYASTNITNHLCKAHAGVHVSQEAAAAVGLVACSCGQVVMNVVVLRKHQGIHKCQMAQPQLAAIQPVVSAPAPTPATPAAVAEAAQPESAPAALAVEQDDAFMQMLDPSPSPRAWWVNGVRQS